MVMKFYPGIMRNAYFGDLPQTSGNSPEALRPFQFGDLPKVGSLRIHTPGADIPCDFTQAPYIY